MPASNARNLTVFRSRLNDDSRPEYTPLVMEMVERVKAYPGFVSFKTFVAEDGERCTIVEFADDASEQAWAHDARHGHAMDRGRDAFFSDYNIKVCTVQRELTPR